MRRFHLLALLTLAACSSNHDQIIKDVCVPQNKENGPKLEDLAKAKGYDIESTRTICRDWFRKEMQNFAKDMEVFKSDSPDPYDAR